MSGSPILSIARVHGGSEATPFLARGAETQIASAGPFLPRVWTTSLLLPHQPAPVDSFFTSFPQGTNHVTSQHQAPAR